MEIRLELQKQKIGIDVGHLLLFAPAYLMGTVIALLLLVVLWMSLRTGLPTDSSPLTLENYRRALTDPFTHNMLLNTIIFASVTVTTVMAFAIPMTFLMQRTNLPFRYVFEVLIGIKILIPSFLVAMGWVLLLSPRNGVINLWMMSLLGLEKAPFSVYSVPMMGYLQGLGFVPVAYFMVAAALRSVDHTLEEASRMSGASTLQTILRVTLPTTLPAIIAAFIYTATLCFAVFDIPAVIGAPLRMFVFSTAIYRSTNPLQGMPEYGLAGAYGSIVLVIGLLLSYLYFRAIRASHKYVVVSGKGYRPAIIELGKWKWPAMAFMAFYFIPALALPFLMLVWISIIPYVQVPSVEALATVSAVRYLSIRDFLSLRPALNTLFLIILAPTITISLSTAMSWIVIKTNTRGRQVLDTLGFLPHTTPSILFAISLAYSALIFRDYLPIYGTLAIVIIAHVAAFISFGTRTMNSALIQLHPELEEAAQMSGASLRRVIWDIAVPLIRYGILNGWIWLALLSFREFTMAITLRTSEANSVLTGQIWEYWVGGRVHDVAVLGVLIFFGMSAFVALARWLGGRLIEQ